MIDLKGKHWISKPILARNFKASVPRRNHTSAHIMSIDAGYNIIEACTERDLVITWIVGRKIVVNYQ